MVVGCGLGDDAALLADRGFEVTAMDVAPAVIARARRRFPDHPVDWRVADLLELPEELGGAFGLAVEVATVQSLTGGVRDGAMRAIAGLLRPGGVLVAIGLLATSEDAARRSGPPWPQSRAELETYERAGLTRTALEHGPVDDAGVIEARVTWTKGPSQVAAPRDVLGIGVR